MRILDILFKFIMFMVLPGFSFWFGMSDRVVYSSLSRAVLAAVIIVIFQIFIIFFFKVITGDWELPEIFKKFWNRGG